MCDVIHWTTRNITLVVKCTEFNSQKTFGIFGCHTKESGNPHPEKGTRSTSFDGCSYPNNVTCTNSCSKSCRKGCKTRNITFPLSSAKISLKALGRRRTCKKSKTKCKVNPSSYKKAKRGGPQTKSSMVVKKSNINLQLL